MYEFYDTNGQKIVSSGNFCETSGVLKIPATADTVIVVLAQIGTTFPFTNNSCNDPAIVGTMTFVVW